MISFPLENETIGQIMLGNPMESCGMESVAQAFIYLFFCGGSIPSHAQVLLLVVLKGPYEMLQIEPRLAACRANALLTVSISNLRSICFSC